MKLVASETSLVIAGAWNPAILTPPWVARHGLEREGDVQVQVFLPVASGGAVEVPRYVFRELSYLVQPGALILALNEDQDDYSVLENTAARALAVLQHTPVSGIGHNFEFRQTQLDGAPLGVFTSSRQDLTNLVPGDWRASGQILTSAFSCNNGASFININRQFDNDSITVKFNFHHPVQSIDKAIEVLHGHEGHSRMNDNLAVATRLMNDLYGDAE